MADSLIKTMPPVMILCGGKGTRLRDVTELLPKPMVSVGEQPIVWHIMKTYAAFGVRRFILCLGYKREAFVDYFMNFHTRISDATIRLGHKSEVVFHDEPEEADWEITLAGTGLDTTTGGRVFRAAKYLRPDDKEFFLTYGDGLCDLDINSLYRTHLDSGKLITITGVHPEARFGELMIEGDSVTGFEEKPPQSTGYINGGFMVINREFIPRYIDGADAEFLEQSPMRSAASNGDMGGFRHEGFWQCMDNQREYNMLNSMWNSGNAPWTKFWTKD